MVANRHIFLTGQPGVGKSTLIARVLDELASRQPEIQNSCLGFWTEEVRRGGERNGFDVCMMDGRRGVLARLSEGGYKGPAVGKYAVDVKSFESLAIPELQAASAATSNTRLCVIDEVGKMELHCRPFIGHVRQALDKASLVVFGTIPVPRYGRDITEVEGIRCRPDVEVFTVTKANRDDLVETVTRAVLASLAAAAKVK